jgi:uncharacterized protein YecE (DUF72 family)
MGGTLFLGTSGFAYDEWRHGVFYPEGLPASRMLGHYAGVFRSVEINYTFRRFPSEATLAAWREQTPAGFRFTLKANQRITHSKRLRDARGEVAAFLARAAALGDKLGPVLFQCPPQLVYDAALLEAFADALPPGLAAAMEFRHPSWRRAWPFLAERGIARCVADTDDERAAAEHLIWQPFGYLRLRRTAYDDGELAVWSQRIAAALAGGRDVYCYFKHEDSAAGPRMARRLEQLLAGAAGPRTPISIGDSRK